MLQCDVPGGDVHVTALAAVAVVALSCLFAAGAPSGDRWRAMKRTITVVRSIRGGWYWVVAWGPLGAMHVESGTSRTWLGARVAAWRAAR